MTTFDVVSSKAHSDLSAGMIRNWVFDGAAKGHWSRNRPFSSKTCPDAGLSDENCPGFAVFERSRLSDPACFVAQAWCRLVYVRRRSRQAQPRRMV